MIRLQATASPLSDDLEEGTEEGCWASTPGCAIVAHGYAMVGERSGARFLWNGELMHHLAELMAEDKKATPREALLALLPRLNGTFNIVLHWTRRDGARRALAATDRFAGHPLYWARADRELLLGGDAAELARATNATLDGEAALAIAAMQFVPGRRTLATGVEELEAGTVMEFRASRDDGTWQASPPHAWWMPEVLAADGDPAKESALEEELAALLQQIGVEWSAALAARHRDGRIAIPLSGGLDSRILLAIFQPHLGEQLVALSYGNPEANDVKLAIEVARVAGVEHRLVPFRDASFLAAERRGALARHIGLTTRLTLADGGLALATAHPDVVAILPGHSGDGISGSRLKQGQTRANPADVVAVDLRSSYTCFDAAVLRPLLRVDRRPMADATIRMLRESVAAQRSSDPRTVLQRWTMRELVRRRVLPELVLYRQFTEPMLPFFDSRLADFFSRVPVNLLIGQRLYNNVAVSKLFTGSRSPLRNVPRQGKGPLARIGDATAKAHPWRALPPRIYNRVLRTIQPEKYERIRSSCPMLAIWRGDANLRREVMETIAESAALAEIFEMGALTAYLESNLGRDYELTTLGVWGLLTVELAHRAWREHSVPPAAGNS